MIQIIIILFAMMAAIQAKSADTCFTMKPTSSFDDVKCSPVKVKIQYQNCESGTARGEPIQAMARFECKRQVKVLKYWHNDAMLVGQLKKSGSSYEVEKTYVQGKPNPSSKPLAAVVATNLAEKQTPKVESTDLALPVKTEMAPDAGINSAPPAVAPEPPPPPPQPPTEAVQKSAEDAKVDAATETGLSLSKIKLAATLDGYYSYNQNNPAVSAAPAAYGASPASQNTYILTNAYHDQLTLNLAELKIWQAADPAGFELDLGFGPLVDKMQGAGVDQSARNLLQGFFTYKAPYDISIDAGKIYSPLGFEGLEAEKNWNYSYSLLYTILPVWHTGVKVTVPLMKYYSASAYAVNGINTLYENNRYKTYGGQLAFDCGHLKVAANIVSGSDTQSFGDVRNFYEANAMWTALPYLKFAVDWAMENETQNGGAVQQLSSSVFYGQLQFLEKFYFVPRYEMFNDQGMAAGHSLGTTANIQMINSLTLGLEYRPAPKYRVMAEYRQDQSSIQVYTNSTGSTNQQAISTLAGVVSF